MKIIERPLTDIIPYERNPRKNDHAVDEVARSIKKYGPQQPIVVDPAGVIIIGHTRLKAAQKLKLKTFPVVVADLPEKQVKELRLADNKTGELALWDEELLKSELEDLMADGVEIDIPGMSLEDIDLALSWGDEEEPPKNEPGGVDKIDEKFMIVIDCESESEQVSIIEKLQGEGIECRALIS